MNNKVLIDLSLLRGQSTSKSTPVMSVVDDEGIDLDELEDNVEEDNNFPNDFVELDPDDRLWDGNTLEEGTYDLDDEEPEGITVTKPTSEMTSETDIASDDEIVEVTDSDVSVNRRDLKAEAKSLRHKLTHKPPIPKWCEACKVQSADAKY